MRKDKPDKNNGNGTQVPKPIITIDYSLYESYLEDSGLSAEQKEERLQDLWNVIFSFVSFGFGVHPLQQASRDCEQVEILAEFLPADSPSMIEYGQQSEIFNSASDEKIYSSTERIQK